MTDATSVAADQLKSIIERIERLEEDKKAIADDIKEVYLEAKGGGFDVVILRRIVSLRKKPAAERAEEEAILELYLETLGMSYTAKPLVPAAEVRRTHAPARADRFDPDIIAEIIEEEQNSPAAAAGNSGQPEHGYSADPEAPMDSIGGTGRPNGGVVRAEVSEPMPNSGQSNSNIAAEPLTINSGQTYRVAVNGALGREECVTAPLEPTSSETPSTAHTGRAVETGSLIDLPDDHKMHVRGADGRPVSTTWGEFRRMQEARA